MAPPARPPPAEALALMMAQTREASLMQQPLPPPSPSTTPPPDQLSGPSTLPPALPQNNASSSFTHPLMHPSEARLAEQAERPAVALSGGSPVQPQQDFGPVRGTASAAGPGQLLQLQSEQEGAAAAGLGGDSASPGAWLPGQMQEDEDLAMAMPSEAAGAADAQLATSAAPQVESTAAAVPAVLENLPSTSAHMQEAVRSEQSDPLGAVRTVRSSAQQSATAMQSPPPLSPSSRALPQASSLAQPPLTAADGGAHQGNVSPAATSQRKLTRELSELEYAVRQGDASLARRFRPTAELDLASASEAGGALGTESLPAAGAWPAAGDSAAGAPSPSQAMDAEGFFSGVAEDMPAPAHPAEVLHVQGALGDGEAAPPQPVAVLHQEGLTEEVPALEWTQVQACSAGLGLTAAARDTGDSDQVAASLVGEQGVTGQQVYRTG